MYMMDYIVNADGKFFYKNAPHALCCIRIDHIVHYRFL